MSDAHTCTVARDSVTSHGEWPVSRTRQRYIAYLTLHLRPALSYVTRYKRFLARPSSSPGYALYQESNGPNLLSVTRHVGMH